MIRKKTDGPLAVASSPASFSSAANVSALLQNTLQVQCVLLCDFINGEYLFKTLLHASFLSTHCHFLCSLFGTDHILVG